MSVLRGPADGATVRKLRIVDILQKVRDHMPQGIPERELVKYASNAHGLTRRTAGAYVTEKIMDGILQHAGMYLILDEMGFQTYLELIGYAPKPVEVQCLDCPTVYTSKMAICPECGSASRTLADQGEVAETVPETCQACGSMVQGLNFCPGCGLDQRPQEVDPQLCLGCSAVIEYPGAKHCPHCGQQLGGS